MKTEYLSISLCLQFLTTMSYIFQCTSSSLPLLSYSSTVHRNVFFTSLSDVSLLVQRNPTYFCMLIWYPETFLHLFIVSNNLQGFPDTESRHLQRVAILLLHSQFRCFFIFFSCLPDLTRTSSTLLNSGRSGHPCLAPEKSFQFITIGYDTG